MYLKVAQRVSATGQRSIVFAGPWTADLGRLSLRRVRVFVTI